MKKIHILFAVAILGLLTSCLKDQEDVFDKSSDVRAEEAIAADYMILAGAEHGWLMKYYPSPYRTFGGYNVIMKFTQDGKVTVASDITNPKVTRESFYKVTQSAGVVLSFDTYNDIFHAFSTPDAPLGGSKGEGWQGDYDFEFISASPEKIVLKGKKSGNYATMVPMKDDQWADFLTKIAVVDEGMDFPQYTMKVGNTDVFITKSYHNYEMTYATATTDTTIYVPYVVAETGVTFYEPININGKEINGFKYVADSFDFPATDDANIVLHGITPPLNETFILGEWFIAYSKLGAFAQPYWDILKKGADGEGENIGVAFFTTDTSFGIYMTSGLYGLFFNFKYELIGEDQIKLYYESKSGTTYEGNADWYVKNAGYGSGMVPFGADKNNPRTFKLTTDNEKSPSFVILTDLNEPTNVITVTASPVTDPFDN